jgi:flagellar motor switch protein FliG
VKAFGDIANLDDWEIKVMLREVEELAAALKGAGREVQNRIF